MRPESLLGLSGMGFARLGAVYRKQAHQDYFTPGGEVAQDARHVLATATKVIQLCRGKAVLPETAPAQFVPALPLLSLRFALSQ